MMHAHDQAFEQAFRNMDDFMQKDFSEMPKDTQYYCQSRRTTILPNGVQETQKITRTNDREEREHYRQLGDQRIVERCTKDPSGKQDLRRDLYNIKENEIEEFNKRWNSSSLYQPVNKPIM